MHELTTILVKSFKFFFKKINYSKAIILSFLSLLLIIAPGAIAGYAPPPDQEPPSDQSK
jgi:hypothetical protein